MADITIINSELTEQHNGQRGFRRFRGIGSFNSTDATGTLLIKGFVRVDMVHVTPAQAPNTDEQLYTSDTVQTSGHILPTNNAITIARTGTKTSGLKFHFDVTGR